MFYQFFITFKCQTVNKVSEANDLKYGILIRKHEGKRPLEMWA